MVSLPVSGTHSFNMQETKLLVVYYTEVWILTSSSDILQLQLSKRLFTQQILSRIHIVNTLSNAVYYISDNFLSWDRYPSRQTTLIQRRNMVEASTLNNGRHFDVEPMLSVLPFISTYCINVIRFNIYTYILYKCYPFYHLHVHTVYMLSVLRITCTYCINVIRFNIYMYILYTCYPFYHLHVHIV